VRPPPREGFVFGRVVIYPGSPVFEEHQLSIVGRTVGVRNHHWRQRPRPRLAGLTLSALSLPRGSQVSLRSMRPHCVAEYEPAPVAVIGLAAFAAMMVGLSLGWPRWRTWALFGLGEAAGAASWYARGKMNGLLAMAGGLGGRPAE